MSTISTMSRMSTCQIAEERTEMDCEESVTNKTQLHILQLLAWAIEEIDGWGGTHSKMSSMKMMQKTVVGSSWKEWSSVLANSIVRSHSDHHTCHVLLRILLRHIFCRACHILLAIILSVCLYVLAVDFFPFLVLLSDIVHRITADILCSLHSVWYVCAVCCVYCVKTYKNTYICFCKSLHVVHGTQ